MKEAQLYQPVKEFLERQGYEVKAEINDCDLVAVRGSEPPVVVELKLSLNMEVLLQAVDRTRVSDVVYVAVAETGSRARLASRSGRRSIKRLFSMLGIGLMTVGMRASVGTSRGTPRIDLLVEPAPYTPRRNLRQQRRLLREFHGRLGDLNTGGTHRAPRLTAYRQDALLCAYYLRDKDAAAPVMVKKATGVERAGTLLYRNVYGWFERPESGSYRLSESGRLALVHYGEVVNGLLQRDGK